MKACIRTTGAALAGALAATGPATAETFLQTGHRLLVRTEGRQDHAPRIVACDASPVGLCLRDTDGTPPNNPLAPHADGLTVRFPDWDVAYVIHPDGTGRTFVKGVEATPFAWSMIPE